MSVGPSGTVVEFQFRLKPLVWVATVVKPVAPLPFTWKASAPIPETEASAEPVSVTLVPEHSAPQPLTVTDAVAGAGVLYGQGPRQQQTEKLIQSPPGFGEFDITAGYSGGGGEDWPSNAEPGG